MKLNRNAVLILHSQYATDSREWEFDLISWNYFDELLYRLLNSSKYKEEFVGVIYVFSIYFFCWLLQTKNEKLPFSPKFLVFYNGPSKSIFCLPVHLSGLNLKVAFIFVYACEKTVEAKQHISVLCTAVIIVEIELQVLLYQINSPQYLTWKNCFHGVRGFLELSAGNFALFLFLFEKR